MKQNLAKILFVISFGLVFNSSFPHLAMAAQAHPAGTLVVSNGTVWEINGDGDERIIIDSAEKFYSNRLSFNYVVPATAGDLALPAKETMPWGDGVLFTDNGTIYQVSGGRKHGFTSAEVFLGQGFAFSQ